MNGNYNLNQWNRQTIFFCSVHRHIVQVNVIALINRDFNILFEGIVGKQPNGETLNKFWNNPW